MNFFGSDKYSIFSYYTVLFFIRQPFGIFSCFTLYVHLFADFPCHAFKVGRFLGWYYGQDHKAKVVIGKDTRRSSYMFEYALVAGLTASGANAYLLHVTTTPSVSYVTRTENFDCGIMISASHNPFYDNGIKVINGKGHKLEAEVEAKIEAYIDGEIDELPLAKKDKVSPEAM